MKPHPSIDCPAFVGVSGLVWNFSLVTQGSPLRNNNIYNEQQLLVIGRIVLRDNVECYGYLQHPPGYKLNVVWTAIWLIWNLLGEKSDACVHTNSLLGKPKDYPFSFLISEEVQVLCIVISQELFTALAVDFHLTCMFTFVPRLESCARSYALVTNFRRTAGILETHFGRTVLCFSRRFS